MKTVWFDIDNSPHVLLFSPVIKALQGKDYNIIVTTRNFAQTLSLLEKYNISYIRVDGYGGRNKFMKLTATLRRAYGIYKRLKNYKIDLMVNHNARAGIIAAKMLGIPIISGFDYEYNERLILMLLSDVVLVPDILKFKFSRNRKFRFYPGLKEEVYLCDFKPNPYFYQELPFENPIDKPLITIRPPAVTANYHDKLSEKIFIKVLEFISKYDCYVVLLPRYKEKQIDYIPKGKARFFIPDKPLSGPDLIFYSDLVISGGGTMVREAVVLKTPAYSIFTANKGAVDSELEREGRLKFIRRLEDVNKIEIQKKHIDNDDFQVSTKVKEFFIKTILDFLS